MALWVEKDMTGNRVGIWMQEVGNGRGREKRIYGDGGFKSKYE